jgi:hypothetical protein
LTNPEPAWVGRIESKLDRLDDKFDAHRDESLQRMTSLEHRVDQLEQRGTRRWSTWQLSGIAGLTAFLTGAVEWFKTLIGG